MKVHVHFQNNKIKNTHSVSEFNEFEPRLKSAKNQFQLSASLNLEKLNTILSEPTILKPRLKFIP